MLKRVIGPGLIGGVVLIVWTFVVNGVLGFQANIDMKQIPAERQVYETLKEHIVNPGRYIFVAIGVLFAIFGDLTNFGIGSYPVGDAIILATRDIIVWTLVGLVVAWRVQPEPTDAASA